jgi:hypothetical protein
MVFIAVINLLQDSAPWQQRSVLTRRVYYGGYRCGQPLRTQRSSQIRSTQRRIGQSLIDRLLDGGGSLFKRNVVTPLSQPVQQHGGG